MPDPGKEGPRRLRPASRTRSARNLDKPGSKPGQATDAAVEDSFDGNGNPNFVGQFLRAARESQRLTLRQLAEETKVLPGGPVPRATIAAIEKGKSDPTLRYYVVLAKALRIDPAEIWERADLALGARVEVSVEPDRKARGELRRRAEELFLSGDYRRALAVFDALARQLDLDPPISEPSGSRERAGIEIARATAARRCGALAVAESCARESLRLTRRFPDLRAQAYVGLAEILSLRGHHGLAEDAASRAVEIATSESPEHLAMAVSESAVVLLRDGQLKAGRNLYAQARNLAIKAGDKRRLTRIEGNLGTCLLKLGQRKAARDKFERALELAHETSHSALQALWTVMLGEVDFEEARFESAERRARGALAVAKPLEHTLTILLAEWLLHRVLKASDPHANDRHRVSHMKKLYSRLAPEEGIDELRHFRETFFDRPIAGEVD